MPYGELPDSLVRAMETQAKLRQAEIQWLKLRLKLLLDEVGSE